MLSRIYSVAARGVEPVLVDCEVDSRNGLPSLTIVGLPDAVVKESKERVISAIKNSGINLVATANNHTYDNGGEAMIRTLDVLHVQGLETIGTQKTVEEKNYVIREVKGVKIGFASYTYESGKNPEGLKTINGITVGKAFEPLLNSFDPYDSAEDLIKMKEVAAKMKADSAEFIVFVVHWGIESEL